jgi:hypothetical protein
MFIDIIGLLSPRAPIETRRGQASMPASEATLAMPLPPAFVADALPFTTLFVPNLFLHKTLSAMDYFAVIEPIGLRKGAPV